MTRGLLLAAVLGLSLALAGPALAKPRAACGPDSFLKHKAYTTQEFMEAYNNDAVLRKRLAKHFHMPEAQLTKYLRSELREVAFQNSGWMGTYGVRQDGKIYPVRTYVRKGTKALGLADGTPLFKLPCGNPFRPALPPVEPPQRPRAGLAPVEPLPAIPPVGPVTVEPASLQSPEEYVLGEEIPQAPIFQVPVSTEGSHFIPFWLPHSGGGGGTTTPEPASVLLVAAGLAVVGGLARRRREH